MQVLEPVEQIDDGAERSMQTQADTHAEIEALRGELATQAHAQAKLHEDVRSVLEARCPPAHRDAPPTHLASSI